MRRPYTLSNAPKGGNFLSLRAPIVSLPNMEDVLRGRGSPKFCEIQSKKADVVPIGYRHTRPRGVGHRRRCAPRDDENLKSPTERCW